MDGVNDGRQRLIDNQVNQQVQRQDLFPLSKKVLIEAAPPVATAAFLTTCAALVIAGQGLDPTANPHISSVMNALLFAYLPAGLLGLLVAVSVKSNPALVGFSSGFILVHLLLPIVIGSVVMNVVKSGETAWVVVVPAFMFVFTILAWVYLCCYPKILHIRRRAVIPPPTANEDGEAARV